MSTRLTSRLILVIGLAIAVTSSANAQLIKPTPEQIDKDIKALIDGGNARTFALRRLDKYSGPLEDKQEEVATLLLKLVKIDKNNDAIRALSVWAREPELKALRDYMTSNPKAVAFVYSKKKYPPAAKDLSVFLEGGGGGWGDVVEALILIGPDAEEYVIPYLSSKTKDGVSRSIEYLSRAGTKKSLDALNKMEKDYSKKDKNLAAAAKIAIGKIEDREKEKKDK